MSSGGLADVVGQLRAIIDELDRAAMIASGAKVEAERAYSSFTEAAIGSAHPQLNIARQEARVAADKADKVARLLAEGATAFAEYVDHIAPGTVPVRMPAPESMPSGEQLSEQRPAGPLSRKLARKMNTTPNSDDGLDNLQTLVNTVQDALPPGGVQVPRSVPTEFRAADTDHAHMGDALLAAFTVAIMGIKAAEVSASLRKKAKAHDREKGREGDTNG